MATSQHKNKKASKSREVRQIAAKTALQKREKSRKGTSKARMTELTDELNRQYAEVGMQPSTTVQLRPAATQSFDEPIQNLADVLGTL